MERYKLLSSDELLKYFDKESTCIAVVFDFETNGLNKFASVLECGAIKYKIDYQKKRFEILDVIDRFYFPREPFNFKAAKVHGLTKEIISENRKGKAWPKYFKEDLHVGRCIETCNLLIAHNIVFDLKFISSQNLERCFCTMRSNKKHFSKYPRLEELAKFYNVNYEKRCLHKGLYDVRVTSDIFFSQYGFSQ